MSPMTAFRHARPREAAPRAGTDVRAEQELRAILGPDYEPRPVRFFRSRAGGPLILNLAVTAVLLAAISAVVITLGVAHPQPAAPTPSVTPTTTRAVPEVAPVVVRTVRLSQQQAGSFDGVVTALWAGRVWLFAAANGPRIGHITQVDQATGRILSTTTTATAPDALAAGPSGLWVANGYGGSKPGAPANGTVWQITDSAHPDQHTTYDVSASSIAVTTTGAWVFTQGTGDHAVVEFLSRGRISHRTVLANDAATTQEGSPAVAACGNHLVDVRLYTWVANGGTNFASEIEVRDPVSGALETSTREQGGEAAVSCAAGTTPVVVFSSPGDGQSLQLTSVRGWQPLVGAPDVADGIAGTPTGLWIVGGDQSGQGHVYRFTGTTLTGTLTLPHPQPGPAAADGEDLWDAQQNGFLVHLRPGNQR